MESAAIRLTVSILPMLILAAALSALAARADVFGKFREGAAEGIKTVISLLPTLCGLLCAIYMLRASGMLDTLSAYLSPVFSLLGIPAELAPLAVIRPFSGSGALAAGAEIIGRSGPDSTAGRIAAVMLSSSETTFYTAGIYFGAAGVRKTRYAIFAAFCAEITAFVFSALTVKWFF